MRKINVIQISLVIVLIAAYLIAMTMVKQAGKPYPISTGTSLHASEKYGALYFVNSKGDILRFQSGSVEPVVQECSAAFLEYDAGILFFLNTNTSEYCMMDSEKEVTTLLELDDPAECIVKLGTSVYASLNNDTYIRYDLKQQSTESLGTWALDTFNTTLSDHHLYWGRNGVLNRMKINGGEQEALVQYSGGYAVTNDSIFYTNRSDLNQIMRLDLDSGGSETVLQSDRESIRLVGAIGNTLYYYKTYSGVNIDIYKYQNGVSTLLLKGLNYSLPGHTPNYICATENYLVIQTIGDNTEAVNLTNKTFKYPLRPIVYNYVLSLEDHTLYLLDANEHSGGWD